jgi:hypothetical protein
VGWGGVPAHLQRAHVVQRRQRGEERAVRDAERRRVRVVVEPALAERERAAEHAGEAPRQLGLLRLTRA